MHACDVRSVGGGGLRFVTKCDRGGGGQIYPKIASFVDALLQAASMPSRQLAYKQAHLIVPWVGVVTVT